MPISRNIIDRFADWLHGSDTITYRVSVITRSAQFIMPLVERLVADDDDGDTLRTAMVPWRYAQRPAIAVYQGEISRCRLDGPRQDAGEQSIPLGGLIVSSGITRHLTPFEAQGLEKHMKRLIENAITAWVTEHCPNPRYHDQSTIDREAADLEAKTLIAAWAAAQHQMPGTANDISEGASDA